MVCSVASSLQSVRHRGLSSVCAGEAAAAANEEAHAARLQAEEKRHASRLAAMSAQHGQQLEERSAKFDAACGEREARLAQLAGAEEDLQARAAAMRELAAADATATFSVGGQSFTVATRNLVRQDRSVLARRWHEHRESQAAGPVLIDGDPSHFQLVLAFLRDPERLPIVADTPQLQWLERQAEYYALGDLAALCARAYKRLDTVRVVQILNGQRNLSGMDMKGLELSDIDFRGASLYRAAADGAKLDHAVLSGSGTNLRQTSLGCAAAAR